jgi:hypothetical protein
LPRFPLITQPLIVFVGNDLQEFQAYVKQNISPQKITLFEKIVFLPHTADELICYIDLSVIGKYAIYVNQRMWVRTFHTDAELIGALSHELAHLELMSDSDIEVRLGSRLHHKIDDSKLSTQFRHSHYCYDARLTLNEYLTDALAIGRGFGSELLAFLKTAERSVEQFKHCGILPATIEEELSAADKAPYQLARKGETLHASGFIALKNGQEFYYGGMKDNLFSGECKMSFGDAIFIGTVEADMPVCGTLFHKNGDIYTGDFSGYKRSGYGRCYYKNGETYVGGWHMDKYNGSGTLYAADGCISKSGVWKMGRLETPKLT